MARDNQPIAFLLLRHALYPCEKQYPILPNAQVDIGRDDVTQAWSTSDTTISKHHLRLRCVIYDDDGKYNVLPLVYVRVLSNNHVKLVRSHSNNSNAVLLTKHDDDILLNQGDVLKLNPCISIVFRYAPVVTGNTAPFNFHQNKEVDRLSSQYRVTDRLLGIGGHANVFFAVKTRAQQQLACKIVSIPWRNVHPLHHGRTLDKDRELRLLKQQQEFAREHSILSELDHSNIIRLEKVILTTYNVYIFLELITGGDLLSYMERRGRSTEPQVAIIVRQILEAVTYLHDKGFVHRDIKPENILMTSWRDGARVLLTDFGQARALHPNPSSNLTNVVSRMHSVVGTYGYTAPEVYSSRESATSKGYSLAIDIWSIGCVTGTLLTNDIMFANEDAHQSYPSSTPPSSSPFSHDTRARFDLEAKFASNCIFWKSISRKAQSFLRACLNVDEEGRLTARQALAHPWFTNKHYADDLNAAYERAIAGWQPKTGEERVVDVVDTSDCDVPYGSSPDLGSGLSQERSAHFASLE